MIRKWIPLTILTALALATAFGCSDNPAGNDNNDNGSGDVSEADSIAAFWMQNLADTLAALGDASDPEILATLDFTAIQAGVDHALSVNATSPTANLAAALVDIVSINFDMELWASFRQIRSTDAVTGEKADLPAGGLYLDPVSPILGNQFALLATAPRELASHFLRAPTPDFSVALLQLFIESRILPAFQSALAHLELAEANSGPEVHLTVDGETIEIDLGEVLVFDASLRAALVPFLLLTAFDMDMVGTDGTYGWVDEMEAARASLPGGEPARIEDDGFGGSRLVYELRYFCTPYPDSILFEALRFNYEDREDFLTRRGTQMDDAYDALLAARDKLESAVAAIRAESDGQEDDIIQIGSLMEIDTEIENDPDKPDFATDFTTIEDVLAWVETLITETYTLEAEGPAGPFTLDINLANYFLGSPQDGRDFLPIFEFLAKDEWVVRESGAQYYDSWAADPLWEYCYADSVDCASVTCTNGFTEIAVEDYTYAHLEIPISGLNVPLQFLDDEGMPVDLVPVMDLPYFPDYTFGGLFPGSTRESWLAIIGFEAP
ncbi:MAG: hypothetical protein QGI43_05755 [Gemmatimonadota bacterium]|nr:hypothetical protein [Gemmatimonadota bacterium]